MAEVKFSAESLKEYERIVSHYPVSKESAVIPVLHLAQRDFGWISEDVVRYVADLMKMSRVRVHGVATFYTMFNMKPVGKYHVQICHNLSCCINQAESLITHVAERLGVKSGETTSDGLFTLTEVECLGACGEGPVIQVNDDYHVNMTKEKANELLDSLRKRG